jgi:ABC-type nitrate/sulfonate/bicarbonate transport system permease component
MIAPLAPLVPAVPRRVPDAARPDQTAVPRDIGFFEWFFAADTWTGDTGILTSLQDTVVLCAAVVLVAVVVSVPTASILAHLRRAEVSSTWLVSISRAVPTFAIAALLVPWSLEQGWGFEPWPIFIALLLLALVPIYLNTYTAIRQLPDGPVDAARALGYSEHSVLTRIELVLASSASGWPRSRSSRPSRSGHFSAATDWAAMFETDSGRTTTRSSSVGSSSSVGWLP